MNAKSYGVMVAFSSPDRFAAALEAARLAGFSRLETYAPYAVEGVAELPPRRFSPVAIAMGIGGCLSGLIAFFGMEYAARDFPLDAGRRPPNSWPAYIPITFELTVLGAALTGFVAFLAIAGLPRLNHPVFARESFRRASQDRFFICIRSDDPRLAGIDRERLRSQLGAESIEEVPA